MLLHSLLVSFILSMAPFAEAGSRVIDLFMPEVKPSSDEMYICSGIKLLPYEEYIVGFQPSLSTNSVHHVILQGCSETGKKFEENDSELVWDCTPQRGKSKPNVENSRKRYGSCSDGYGSFLFGFANDGLGGVKLPPEVGFRVGGNSNINYLVLNVHYRNISAFKADEYLTDSSGVTLQMVSGTAAKNITNAAGILYNAGGKNPYVPTGLSRQVVECQLDEDRVIHPFRFRVHTHYLGYNVAGFRRSGTDLTKFSLIGQQNPQLAQSYFPVTSNSSVTLTRGDRFYTHCDYNNDRGQTVLIGPTSSEEMCTFYLMYWVEGKERLQNEACFG